MHLNEHKEEALKEKNELCQENAVETEEHKKKLEKVRFFLIIILSNLFKFCLICSLMIFCSLQNGKHSTLYFVQI